MLQRAVMALCVAALIGVGVSAQQTPPPKPADTQATPPRPNPGMQNVRIELTITDQRDGTQAAPKTLSLILTDRNAGRMRTGTGRDDGMLNVDLQPEIVRENRVRLSLMLEYRPPRTGDKDVLPVTQSLSTILDDGRPLVVSQSAEPGSNRSVKVELKATILK